MDLIDLLILVIASIANLLIGLATYLKNPSKKIHQLFGLLTISLIGWTTANYISITASDYDQIYWSVRFILTFVTLQNVFFFMFVSYYPENILHLKKKFARAYLALSFITVLTSLYPGFFTSYHISGDSISPEAGPAISLFMLHTFVSIGAGIIELFQRYKHSYGTDKNRIKFLLLASLVLFVLTPITNFILPLVFSFYLFAPLSPVYTLIFASIIAYAIVSKKLFDIRSAVARLMVYVLSVGTVVGIYSASTVGLANLIFKGQSHESLRTTLSVLFAGVLAISFQRIKTFFDKNTTKLFFQDAYDPQQLIDSLNKVFVSNVELDTLLIQTNTIIENSLKAEYSTFLINKTSYDPDRWIGGSYHLPEREVGHLNQMLVKSQSKIIITEYLDDNDDLRKFLVRNNIAVLARLVPRIDYELPGIGLLVLGPKRSGNLYGNQDSRVLEIIANELVIAVENALRFEEIEKFNITLQQKVDKATSELRATNKKLIDLDEAKDEFISMASHQLRTPLTSMKGYVSMVLEGDSGKINDMQKKLLDQAFVSSQRMVYLIADLLNVSRLKTGKFIIESKPTNLAKIVEEEVSQLVETAKGRNLELTFDKPKDFPLLMLDETKIRQVVMNFTDNAIYYTPAGGHIHVYVEDKGSTIECRVVDDGLGVPKAEQHHLFTKFYRAGNAKKARPDGTGLGLFMAKKVIVAQGGALIFTSQEGKGSTFGFSFNKAKLTPTPEQLKSTEVVTTTVSTTDENPAAPAKETETSAKK